MNTDQNQFFYFLFGYHAPDAWETAVADPNFDYDSTGFFAIHALNETAALKWGERLAAWYMSQLYADHPELNYAWSTKRYATWIESDLPVGCEEVARDLPPIQNGSYPDFQTVKTAFRD
jgi:hypothetical protein